MNTKHTPATPLPEMAVNINGDLGVKDWRRDPHNGMTQRLTLDERREVARRANAYPRLVEALRAVDIAAMSDYRNDWSVMAAAVSRVRALLAELGKSDK